jgi:hypothetical protein
MYCGISYEETDPLLEEWFLIDYLIILYPNSLTDKLGITDHIRIAWLFNTNLIT